MAMHAIESYKVIIECREAAGHGGFIQLGLADGGAPNLPGVKSYAELAALADMLRNEPDLDWDDAERIVQRKGQPVGRAK